MKPGPIGFWADGTWAGKKADITSRFLPFKGMEQPLTEMKKPYLENVFVYGVRALGLDALTLKGSVVT